MKHPRTVLLIWITGCLLYLAAILSAVGITKAYPGDELRFIETSRLFAAGITLDLLQHYPEMSGPLPFAVFSLWGRAFGWELGTMRLLAVAIALATLVLLHLWLRHELRSPNHALLAGLVLYLNPYIATMSVFLYTDMISVFFVLAALISVQRQSTPALALSLCAALLCRQYLVFLIPAFLLYYWPNNRRMIAATTCSATPLAALVVLWRGLAPDSHMRTMFLTTSAFHVSAFIGYTALLFVYLSPFALLRWRRFIPKPPIAALAFTGALLYWLFPLRPSPSALQQGIATVGLFDRLLQLTMPTVTARDAFYSIAFALGLMVLAPLARDAARRQLPALIVVCFLAVMPFSYLYWEKYFLPVLPIAAIAILRNEQPDAAP